MCIIGGYVFTLLFESPFLVLEKMLFSRKKNIQNELPQVQIHTKANGIDNPAYISS